MRAKTQIVIRGIGIGIIASSIILVVAYIPLHHQIIRFFEIFFSSDQSLTTNGIRELVSTYFFGAFLMAGAGYFLYQSDDNDWRMRIKQIFLNEPACRVAVSKLSPQKTLTVSTLAGIILIISMRIAYRFPAIYPALYAKDHGIIDVIVPATMAISSLLIGATVWVMWKEQEFTKLTALPLLTYVFISIVLFVYAGEEISWGQDFLGWSTPEIFAGNLEGQTNLHNYLNPYFDYGYIAISLIIVVLLFAVWLEYKQHLMPYGRLIMPHPGLIGLGLLITFVSIVWFHEEELLEEMVAVFVLFYSLRVFINLRHPNSLIKSCQQEENCYYLKMCKSAWLHQELLNKQT